MKKYVLALGMITMFCVFILFPNANAVHINLDNVYFIVGNERYNCSDMDFSSITIDSDHIIFNTTGFFVDAPNDINITLYFINGSMSGSEGDNLLNFSSKTSGGFVYFNISGFVTDANYTINRTGNWYDNDTANASGYINWTNSDWGIRQFWDVYIKTPIVSIITFLPVFLSNIPALHYKLSYYPMFLFLILPIFFYFRRRKNVRTDKTLE